MSAVHVHVGRLVVDGPFDADAFERALAAALAPATAGTWHSRAIDLMRLQLPAGAASAALGSALGAGVRRMAAGDGESGSGRR